MKKIKLELNFRCTAVNNEDYYVVRRVHNSTEWDPGDALTKKQVDEINYRIGIREVNVVIDSPA